MLKRKTRGVSQIPLTNIFSTLTPIETAWYKRKCQKDALGPQSLFPNLFICSELEY